MSIYVVFPFFHEDGADKDQAAHRKGGVFSIRIDPEVWKAAHEKGFKYQLDLRKRLKICCSE